MLGIVQNGKEVHKMKKQIVSAAFAALLAATGFSYAQGAADGKAVFLPGDMMSMAMTDSVFNAFFTDKEGNTARGADEFMTMFNSMSASDKMVVRVACSFTDEARKGFSDRISASCRKAGF